MDNEINSATREILRMNEDIVKMSEQTFVSKWLLTLRDYISGEPVRIGYWLDENNITSFGEVQIVNSQGDAIFRVPSILAKADKILPDSVSSNVSDIMYRVDNLNRMIPGKGHAYIESELTNRVIQNMDHGSYQQRWDAIFTRYDLEPVFNKNLSNAAGSQATTIQPGEDFDDYDEL